MNPFKPASNRTSIERYGVVERSGRNRQLKDQRLAQEDAKKAAGIWGDLSVGVIGRDESAFVLIWKGTLVANPYKLAMKRPKEVQKPDHEQLCLWLKAGQYEGFNWSTKAWNVNIEEAQRIKREIIARLSDGGTRVVNSTAPVS